MSEPKTAEDHRTIAFRILQSQGLTTDVIAQIVVHIDGAIRLAQQSTTNELLNKLDSVITVAQRQEVAHALRS